MTGNYDPAIVNLPFSKRRSLDAQIDEWKREEARKIKAAQRERVEKVKVAREAERARPKFSAEALAGDIRAVEIDGRWHHVVRLNAKTVTVPSTLGPWDERIPLSRVTRAVIDGQIVTP